MQLHPLLLILKIFLNTVLVSKVLFTITALYLSLRHEVILSAIIWCCSITSCLIIFRLSGILHNTKSCFFVCNIFYYTPYIE